ncbi:MAG: hypothetical protein HGA65_04810, partial [Oscillochloris sp.]|nr:hypothetical protein [Oscillochloris sp.]
LHNRHGFWILEAIDSARLSCRPADAALVRDTLGDLVGRLSLVGGEGPPLCAPLTT